MADIPSRRGSEKAWIVVVHKAGFALRSPEQLAASAEVTLVPWGRIEGVVKIGARTCPESTRLGLARAVAGFTGADRAMTPRPTRTAASNSIYVAPGRMTVGRQVHDKDGERPHAVESGRGRGRARPNRPRRDRRTAVRSSAGSLSRRAPSI